MRIPPEREGERLDVVLAETLGSRTRAQRLIEEGRVTVDGAPTPSATGCAAGEVVEVDEPPEPAAPERVDVPFGVAYEDEHLVVVDKPAGVVVHPAQGPRAGTLAQALEGTAKGGGDAWRAGIVHRLDRDTSGLMVVAKSEEAHRRLKAMIQRARGRPRVPRARRSGARRRGPGTIDAPIGRDRRHRTRVSTDTDEPREAVTHFAIERALPRGDAAARAPGDGAHAPDPRPSQAIGHPVAGDPDYGGAGGVRPAAPVPPRRAARVRPPLHGRGGRPHVAAAGGPRRVL